MIHQGAARVAELWSLRTSMITASYTHVCPSSWYSNGNVRWPRRVLPLVSHVKYALKLIDRRTDWYRYITLSARRENLVRQNVLDKYLQTISSLSPTRTGTCNILQSNATRNPLDYLANQLPNFRHTQMIFAHHVGYTIRFWVMENFYETRGKFAAEMF